MKGKLWAKLFIAFTSVIILCGVMIMGVITYRITRDFRMYVKTGDLASARMLEPLIEGFYETTGSFEGVLEYLEKGRMVPFERGRMNGIGDRGNPGMGPDISRRILITDKSDRIVADSRGELEGSVLEGSYSHEGVEIESNGKTLGRIYMGTMAEPALNPLGAAFLSDIRKSVITAVIPAIILALIVTYFIVRHITRPLTSMKNAAGKISRGDFSVRTEIKRSDELGDLASAFDEMAVSLQEGDEWKKQIIADSAHELRTPVALIQGTLEMISDGIYPADPDRIRGLYEESLRLSELIADLQELAGLEAEGGKNEFTRIDPVELAGEVADSFAPVLSDKKAELSINKSDMPSIEGNPGRLKQVFINLFSNALRYIPEKGHIQVDFKYDKSAGEIEVSVVNDGPPIPDEDLEKIFERFYRVERSRNSTEGGRGLGLAICSEIIKNHKGSISAENLPEKKGVKFAFRIPVLL